jgi:ParB-like chromosome segregation protein Spo0J
LVIRPKAIKDLHKDPKNARVHGQRQITLLGKNIRRFGFIVPVLIDDRNNVLAGHARLLAAERAGLSEVPTIELSHLSPVLRK